MKSMRTLFPARFRSALARLRAGAPSCVVGLVLALALTAPAAAATIVDTGPGPDILGGLGLACSA
jgi:hypothetical protein